ncbi:hypothetical protein OS31_39810 [Dickeya oryzae]
MGVSLPTPHLRINLWDHTPPGGGGPADLPHLSARGALSHIATPYLEVFTPEKPNGQAILVAAGGRLSAYRNGQRGLACRRLAGGAGVYGLCAGVSFAQ